jgi:hypothetical protein
MIKINPMKYLGGLAVVLLLSACGGGSPESIQSGVVPPPLVVGPSPTVVLPPRVAAIAISVVTAAGASVNSIALDGGYSVQATLTDAEGRPVASKALTFAIEGTSIALLTPGTELTNASGMASVSISPASVSSIGAATLTVSADLAGTAVSSTRDFSVQAANIALSPLRVGSSALNSGGNTSIAVTALLGGTSARGTPVNVSFTASCGRINEGVASVTTDGSGVASAVYTAVQADGSPCSGPTTLAASTAGATAVATTVNVAAPVANAINFVSASPQQVFISGSGAVEQAQLTFRVFSSSLAPIANQSVEFRIVTNPGGVGLGASGSATAVTATTDSSGVAFVPVFAGSIPGPVKVRASLPGTQIFAESQNMTVASGPPSQRFFSLAVETFNIEGGDLDGVSTQLTVRAADRQGNAVEDGTVVNFTSEGGQVARSCATTRTDNIASCSVTFVSQAFRPANGRVSVLAYAEGTKDYVDNGDNKFGAGDTLIDIGDAYRDDNENGVYDIEGEFTLPRRGTNSCAGTGAAAPARANTCDGMLATTVRKQAIILFSRSAPRTPPAPSANGETVIAPFVVTAASVSFQLASFGNPNLPMPAGTTVTAEAVDLTPSSAIGVTPAVVSPTCTVVRLFGSPVANVNPGFVPSEDLSTPINANLSGCTRGDRISFEITSPTELRTILLSPPIP